MDKKRKSKKKLKLSSPKTKSCPYNPDFICDKEAVIELEKLSDFVVAEMTAGGSALPPEKSKKKFKLSPPKTKSCPSNPHTICNKEAVIELEKLSDSVVAEMTAGGSALPSEQSKKKFKLSSPKTKSCPSNPHAICDKEAVIELEKLSDSVVAEMTAGGSALPPEQSKKKFKLSSPKAKSCPSNPHAICDKEAVIELEKLSDSVVAEMTAGGSALPPEQSKKKFKLSSPKAKSCPSNPHAICDKEAVIELEKLSDSVVAEMTAGGSALPPEQSKKKFKLSSPKTKSCPSNPHAICDKEAVIELEKLSDSVVAEMTAGGSALPPEQSKKKFKLSSPKTKSCPSNPHTICNKEAVIELEKLSDSVIAEMTAGGSALPPEQVNESNDDVLDINSFPNEIILKVFGYLEVSELGQVGQVCRRWNMLTKSPVLWKRVNFKFSSSHTPQITMVKSFIDRLPHCVTSIKLDFTKSRDLLKPLNFVELCVKLHEKFPHLEELILVDSDISNSLSVAIDLCSYFLQDVKNLAFHHCIFPTFYTAIGELGCISKIEVLDLSWCILNERFNKAQFSRMPCLKVLCFYETIIHDSLFLNDTSFLNQLHVLDLRWTGINGSTFPVILNHGHNLKKLYICGIKLQGHDLNFDNSVFPHLNTICLSNTCVTPESVVSLIQSCPSLQNVYVSEYVARSFAVHPFFVANRCKSGIVKAIDPIHEHNVDYLHN